jgi:hypothetical protein
MPEEFLPKIGFQASHGLMVHETCFHRHILFFILMRNYDSEVA